MNVSKTVWDLSPLFKSDDDPEIVVFRSSVEDANKKFVEKWQNRQDYLESAVLLKEALDELENLNRNFGSGERIYEYFELRKCQEQNSPQVLAKFNQAHDFYLKMQNGTLFFGLRLAKIVAEKQTEFLQDNILSPYWHFLEKIFNEAPYLLSEAEEKILTLKSDTSYSNWVNMTSRFLNRETRSVKTSDGEKTLPIEAIQSLFNDPVKETRDAAAAAFNDILAKNVDLAESELNSILKNKQTDDSLRNLPRPELNRFINDDVAPEVIDAMVNVVSIHNQISQRYYALKAKLLNVPKLAYHERNVPYGSVNKKYSYETGVNLVAEVFENLDSEFAIIFKGFVENGQVDVFPKPGKTGGAFCSHSLITLPTYILLNHTEELNDVLTIAHEAGHGINNELAKSRQNSLNFGTSTATAEVASTFMEDFVLEKILSESDDELRLAILMMKLNGDISSIFRQVACFRFEQELHKAFRSNGYLSKNEIGAIFQKQMFEYMGDSVEKSEGCENWWVYWSHIRRYFYVYSYASGLLISKALQNFVKDDPQFILKVKEFLSTGLSDSPRNIFLKMGIDITKPDFWDKGLSQIDSLLTETENLARKLGKI